MKQPESDYIARKFEKLNNLFYLMVGLPLLVFTWIYLNLKTISTWRYFEDPTAGIFLHGLILFGALYLLVFAFLRYRRDFTALEASKGASEQSENLEEKTERFFQASIRKYLMLTGSTILVIVGFYLSAEAFYAAIYSILIIAFSINRPTSDKMAKDMRLKKEERQTLKAAVR